MLEFLHDLELKHAAKQYADKLRPYLERNWGGKEATETFDETFTPAQIVRAVVEEGLNPDYIAFGYAIFLTKREFDALLPEMRVKIPFDVARAMFIADEPVVLDSRHTPGHTRGGGIVNDEWFQPAERFRRK